MAGRGRKGRGRTRPRTRGALPSGHVAREGISSVEGLVALIIFSTAILGAAAAAGTSSRVLVSGERDSGYASAVQEQLEILRVRGYGITTGDNATQPTPHHYDPATPTRYPMRWTVTGTNPKRVVFVAQRQNAPADTLVLYVAAPPP